MFQLPEPDQQLLLRIARGAVGSHLAGQPVQLPDIQSGTLLESRGVFVSLHIDGELRGCIGNIQPPEPLYRTTANCAISAAVGDPRFMPLTERELAAVTFEISVLSEMTRIEHAHEIEIGTHGLLITKRTAQGLLLPQVAGAYGWDAERFLAETCRKAGLQPDAWKDGAIINRFCAFVFSEHRLHLRAIS